VVFLVVNLGFSISGWAKRWGEVSTFGVVDIFMSSAGAHRSELLEV